jgi:amidohydrolase
MRALLACGLLFGMGCAQASAIEALAAPLDAKVQTWRRDIHQNPELSNREVRTAALVAEHLRALGLEEIRTGLAHHGVTAVLRGAKPGPRIALRADMDALPVTEQVDLPFASKITTEFRGETVGVMHACGHDAHTAILMGVAEALAAQRERLAGEILFVFQPAEEGAPAGEQGGASLMLREGLFKDFRPEAMFGLHVWSALHVGEIGYRSGPFMAASDSFAITVKGRQTHGSRPWGGIDPIAISALLVASAQQIVSREMDISRLPVVLSFGAIKGGIRFNIIPDQVELIGTIRSFDAAMREDVLARLRRIAEHTAAAHGATVALSVPDPDGNPVTVNDPALTARMLSSLHKVVGAERVREISLVMGAEDFSYYALEVPALFFFVGATPRSTPLAEAPSNHSPHFFLDEKALRIGLRGLLQLVADYGLLPGRG